MNSLYYFWNEYPIKKAKKKDKYIKDNPEINPNDITIAVDYKFSPEQADLFEGTIGFNTTDFLKKDFGKHLLSDAILRSVGFQYCNTLCFYRLDYSYDGLLLQYDIPNMNAFGDFIVIIKDKDELLRRVNNAAEREKIHFLCGDVHYRGLKNEGKDIDISQRHHVVFKCDSIFEISDFEIKGQRDCFVKMDKYTWQNEWRIALYRGIKDTAPYRLEIGNIRDIVECVDAKDFPVAFDKMFGKGLVKRSTIGFYGNIDRKRLREKYYLLGDNKVELFCLFG